MTDTSGPTAETLQLLHQSELRFARHQCLWRAQFLLVAVGFWVVVGPTRVLSFVMILGGSLFLTAVAAREWWHVARTDPLALSSQRAAEQVEAAANRRAQNAELQGTRPPGITLALIGMISVVGLLQIAGGGMAQSVGAAGLIKPAARAGEWWRLLTGTYLHGSLIHFAANMSALSVIGRLIELYAPRTRVALVYLVAALAGSATSLIVSPLSTSVGASGGILGLLGFLLVLARRRRDDVPPGLEATVLTNFGLTGCIGLFGFAFIDNSAHVGGTLAGIAVGILAIPRGGEDEVRRARAINALGWAAAVLLIAGAFFTAQRILRAERGRQTAAAARTPADVIVPFKTVSARVVSTSPANAVVAVRNFRDVPIDAWVIDLQGVDRRPVERIAVDACCGHVAADRAPIRPDETRMMSIGRQAGSTAFGATLKLVLFSDLSFEGSTNERDQILRRRQDRAADLAYAIETLNQALNLPIQQVPSFLRQRVDARAREAEIAHRAFDQGGVPLLLRTVERQPAQFADEARRHSADLGRERVALSASVKK